LSLATATRHVTEADMHKKVHSHITREKEGKVKIKEGLWFMRGGIDKGSVKAHGWNYMRQS
jgi:hypothetical protein